MKNKTKNAAAYFATITASLIFLVVGNKIAASNLTIFDNYESPSYSARVTETTVQGENIVFSGVITGGDRKGEEIIAIQLFDEYSLGDVKKVEKNDRVLIFSSEMLDFEQEWIFLEYQRIDKLVILSGVFALLVLIFGRKKGFNTILSLSLICAAVFSVFIPSILSGRNIYISSIVICAYSIAATILIVNGYDRKSLSAIIGCLGGVLVAGLLTLFMNTTLHLTGMVSEESVYLTYLQLDKPLDLRAVIFASVIVGALGAIMDIAMSISSALFEIKQNLEDITFKKLAKSGLNIGRDIMGTMANTLILAYIGSSLSLVLILSAYNNSLQELLNKEMIVVEIMQAIIGSIGILFTIPLTSIIGAYIYNRGVE